MNSEARGAGAGLSSVAWAVLGLGLGLIAALLSHGTSDGFIVADIVTFVVIVISERDFRPTMWTWVAPLLYAVGEMIAGDSITILIVNGFKLFIFFYAFQRCLTSKGVSENVFVFTLMFLNGMLLVSLFFFSLAYVAKYICPGLYVTLFIALLGGWRSMDKYAWLPFAVSVIGVVLGHYRGSVAGFVLFIGAFLILSFPIMRRFVFRHRRKLLAVFLVGSLVVPAVVAAAVITNIVKAGGEGSALATKSNIERSAMIVLAAESISEHPIFGRGYTAGADVIAANFDENLPGYVASSSLHNQFWDYLFFTGVVGVLIMGSLYIRSLSQCIDLARIPVESDSIIGPNKPLRLRFWAAFFATAPYLAVLAILIAVAVAPFSAVVRQYDLMVIAALGMVFASDPENRSMSREPLPSPA